MDSTASDTNSPPTHPKIAISSIYYEQKWLLGIPSPTWQRLCVFSRRRLILPDACDSYYLPPLPFLFLVFSRIFLGESQNLFWSFRPWVGFWFCFPLELVNPCHRVKHKTMKNSCACFVCVYTRTHFRPQQDILALIPPLCQTNSSFLYVYLTNRRSGHLLFERQKQYKAITKWFSISVEIYVPELGF